MQLLRIYEFVLYICAALITHLANLLGETGGTGDALIGSVVRSVTRFHNITVVY